MQYRQKETDDGNNIEEKIDDNQPTEIKPQGFSVFLKIQHRVSNEDHTTKKEQVRLHINAQFSTNLPVHINNGQADE